MARSPPKGASDVDKRREDAPTRDRIDSALRQQDLLLRLALESGDIGIHHWNPATGELVWDDRVRAQWGVRPNTPVSYETFIEGVHPADRPAVEAAVARALDPASGGHYRIDYRVIGVEDRVERWIVATGQTIFEDGEPVGFVGTTQDVTARKWAEIALQESEARFRAVFELSSVGMAQADPETGRLLSVNKTFARMLGYEPAELIGRCFSDLTHPDDRAADWDKFACMVRGEASFYESEKRYVRKDGSVIWVRVTANLVGDSLGQPLRTVAVIQDVTERKRAEIALQENESRLRMALAAAKAGAWESDPESGLFIASESARALHGLPANQPLDHDVALGAVHPDDRGLVAAALDRTLSQGAPFRVEYRAAASCDGPQRWLASMAEMRAQTHPPRLVGLVQDISERKQAEELLRQSEQRFRQVVQSLPQLVWTCRPDGACDYLSPQWLRYTGVPEAPQLGYGWLEQLHPDDRERVIAHWQETTARGDDFAIEFRVRRFDGVYRWFYTLAVPLRDEEGRIYKWFGSNTDITETRKAAETLKEADRRKDEFLATLAHELRNPLASIANAGHVLNREADKGTFTPQQKGLFELIARQVAHLTRLVDDLLEVTRISTGKIDLKNESVSLGEILARAVEMSESAIDAGGHALQIDAGAELLVVNGDVVRLTQVIANLIGNAAKYTPRNGHIEVSLRRSGEEAVVSVRDDGIGVSAEMLPRVFDLFSQASESRTLHQGGIGVGLALVKGLVDLHGGRVEAFSAGLGMGSEFVIRLPLASNPLQRE